MMCVSGAPGFVPPVANFDCDSADVSLPGFAAPVNKAKKGDVIVFLRHKTVAGQLTLVFVFSRRFWEEAKGPWSGCIRKQLSAGGHDHWRQNPAGKYAALVFALSQWLHTPDMRLGRCCRSNRRRRTVTVHPSCPTELSSESWTWRSWGCCSTVCCPVHCSTRSSKPT